MGSDTTDKYINKINCFGIIFLCLWIKSKYVELIRIRSRSRSSSCSCRLAHLQWKIFFFSFFLSHLFASEYTFFTFTEFIDSEYTVCVSKSEYLRRNRIPPLLDAPNSRNKTDDVPFNLKTLPPHTLTLCVSYKDTTK